ncbi:MAG TPA: galactokinase [archaeon]|nr:galactokinase [archaeon]
MPLGGGGTDLPAYYTRYGGHWLSAGINRHMYIVLHGRSIEPAIKLKYSKIEETNSVDKIEHGIFRSALKRYGIKDHLELTSIADVGAGTGLGSSGSFTVALLAALHAYQSKECSPSSLAEEAFEIEMSDLNLPVGKQDQYAAAFGGIRSYTAGKDGKIEAKDLGLDGETVLGLESNLLLFFTNYTRSSIQVLDQQGKKIAANQDKAADAMHQIKEIGKRTQNALERGDIDQLGPLLDEHWKLKRGISDKMSNDSIDKWYSLALKNGATGGKIVGAGGGGFFMFYCPSGPKNQEKLRSALANAGLSEMRYKFDFSGATTLLNLEGDE